MVKWSILAVMGILVSLSTLLFFRLGVYKSVELTHVSDVEFHFLFKDHRGPYHQILPTIQEVEAVAKSKDINCSKTFGEYLDDPQSKNEADLRSNGGCILTEPIKNLDLSEGIKFRTDPAQQYLKATFQGSPAIGPFKVYPKALEWFKAEDRPISTRVLEVYQILEDGSMKTEYYFPL